MGITSIDVWRSLQGRPSQPIATCRGDAAERSEALSLLKKGARGVLLEPAALYQLHRMKVLVPLIRVVPRLAIVRTTLDDLRVMLAELDRHRGGYLTTHEHDGQFFYTDVTSQAVQQERRDLQNLLDWAVRHCEIALALPKSDQLPEAALALSQILPPSSEDSLLAAQGGDFILVSDDAYLRALGRSGLNIDAVWIQALLMHVLASVPEFQYDYDRAVGLLCGWRHQFTSVGERQLLFAARRNGWRVTPEFESVAATLTLRSSEFQSNLGVVVRFLRVLWSGSGAPSHKYASRLTAALLKGLNPTKVPGYTAYYEALRELAARGLLSREAWAAVQNEWPS